jgi:hypothetical protein
MVGLVYWLAQVVHTLLDDGVQSLMYSKFGVHNVTTAQAVQVVAPEMSEKLDPAAQPEHAAEPAADEYVPAVQFTQFATVDVPCASPTVPAGQSMGETVPLGQYAFLGHVAMVDELRQ